MAMGYCMLCEKLVAIRQVRSVIGYYPDWKPIMHTASDGSQCDGHKKVIK